MNFTADQAREFAAQWRARVFTDYAGNPEAAYDQARRWEEYAIQVEGPQFDLTAPPAYGQPTPSAKKSRVGLVVGLSVLAAVLLLTIGTTAVFVQRGHHIDDVVDRMDEKSQQDLEDDLEDLRRSMEKDGEQFRRQQRRMPSIAPTLGTEEKWRRGVERKPVPDGVNQPYPDRFLPNYANPEEWLTQSPGNAGISVVFTGDVAYNCGGKNASARGFAAYGCYDPAYGPVLFLYWDPSAPPHLREFILAHELSHYMQWTGSFDTMQSASKAGLDQDAAWASAKEADATCRVRSWGGYDEWTMQNSSSPCTVDDWYEGWLTDEARRRGVTITDY